jgi:hypothetical protein
MQRERRSYAQLQQATTGNNDIANCDGCNYCHCQLQWTQSTQSSWDTKALTRGAPPTQQGRTWQSALKPRGGLVDECNKGIVRALWVSWQYSYRGNKYCRKDVNCCNACATNANCNIFPTSAGVKGRTLNAMMATIVTVSMANANNNNNKSKQQKKQSHCDTYAMRHTRVNCWTSSKLSCLAEPVTLSSVTKEQTQAMTTKNYILLVLQK